MFRVFSLLAARKCGPELAVRLFGTRWCRGYFHFLSTSERTARTAILAKIQSLLGEERFAQLRQKGQALTFMQMLATARVFLDLR